MQHDDQHIEAIKKTMAVRRETTACVFDDKVKEMGRIKVANGTITVNLDYVPSMISEEATASFLADAIRVAIRECFFADPAAFEKTTR